MFGNNFNILLITDVMLHKARNTNVRHASCEMCRRQFMSLVITPNTVGLQK
jgi:hypothetical protein